MNILRNFIADLDEDEIDKYERVWRNYKDRLNERFTWLMVIFVGIPFIGFAFILWIIDYPEPFNISMFGIP